MSRKKSSQPVLVTAAEQVAELCEHVAAERQFAFDTEFVMEDVAAPEVCLIQIATEHRVFLVDTLTGVDVSPIWELVVDPAIETIVHAGQEDLAICFHAAGKAPRNVFDIQIAAGLVGTDYPLSLARLAQNLIHVRLHKTQTLTDWRRRPLSAEQLRYAEEDVSHLPRIRRLLGKRLDKHGRVEWATEEHSRFEDIRLYRQTDSQKLGRVKGVGSLGGKQLAVATELVLWRDEMARKLNRPARTILKDHLLSEIARTGLSQPDHIANLRGINLSKRQLVELSAVLEQAAQIPPERWPEPKGGRPETPRETILTTLITAVMRSETRRLNVAYGLAATKKNIQELVRACPNGDARPNRSLAMLEGWRGEAFGEMLLALLQGRSAVRVGEHDGEAILRLD